MYLVLRSQFTVDVDAFHFLYKFRRDVSILIGSFLWEICNQRKQLLFLAVVTFWTLYSLSLVCLPAYVSLEKSWSEISLLPK